MFDILSSCQVKEGLSSSGQVEFKHSGKYVCSLEDNKRKDGERLFQRHQSGTGRERIEQTSIV
jgi:hypothetical protein